MGNFVEECRNHTVWVYAKGVHALGVRQKSFAEEYRDFVEWPIGIV